ncbi:MAG: hypothetical protein ACJAZ0_000012 [Halioglobus sp.]|jgi:hypothetical protein
MKDLDFLIIGAQKCATTTLFEYLRGHPDIAMPLEKEVPFFCDDNCSSEDWSEFSARNFADANTRQLWGKATPQYMSDPGAAERIHALMPDTKLVAILRDPVERSWSHYRMGQRRETENRDFAVVIDELLASDRLEKSRTMALPMHEEGYQPEGDFYVAWSEYGRILSEFLNRFNPQQLLVLYTEDLESDPEGTLDRLLSFIGLQPGYRPATLGKRLHRGGSNRVSPALRRWLRERRAIYWFWQMLPDVRRGRMRFQYEQWNVRELVAPAQLPDDLMQQLLQHFSQDLVRLQALPVPAPPWANRYIDLV